MSYIVIDQFGNKVEGPFSKKSDAEKFFFDLVEKHPKSTFFIIETKESDPSTTTTTNSELNSYFQKFKIVFDNEIRRTMGDNMYSESPIYSIEVDGLTTLEMIHKKIADNYHLDYDNYYFFTLFDGKRYPHKNTINMIVNKNTNALIHIAINKKKSNALNNKNDSSPNSTPQVKLDPNPEELGEQVRKIIVKRSPHWEDMVADLTMDASERWAKQINNATKNAINSDNTDNTDNTTKHATVIADKGLLVVNDTPDESANENNDNKENKNKENKENNENKQFQDSFEWYRQFIEYEKLMTERDVFINSYMNDARGFFKEMSFLFEQIMVGNLVDQNNIPDVDYETMKKVMMRLDVYFNHKKNQIDHQNLARDKKQWFEMLEYFKVPTTGRLCDHINQNGKSREEYLTKKFICLYGKKIVSSWWDEYRGEVIDF